MSIFFDHLRQTVTKLDRISRRMDPTTQKASDNPRKGCTRLCSTSDWRSSWQAMVPKDCRNVPVTVNGQTETAFILVNQFAVLLQDGLLMEQGFFRVCKHFQAAGYHVIWIFRCVQDIDNNWLKQLSPPKDGKTKWLWRKPTTNFGRWTSDNYHVTIVLQTKEISDKDYSIVTEPVLERVIWAESDDAESMIPRRTIFHTVSTPSTPMDIINVVKNKTRWHRT